MLRYFVGGMILEFKKKFEPDSCLCASDKWISHLQMTSFLPLSARTRKKRLILVMCHQQLRAVRLILSVGYDCKEKATGLIMVA